MGIKANDFHFFYTSRKPLCLLVYQGFVDLVDFMVNRI